MYECMYGQILSFNKKYLRLCDVIKSSFKCVLIASGQLVCAPQYSGNCTVPVQGGDGPGRCTRLPHCLYSYPEVKSTITCLFLYLVCTRLYSGNLFLKEYKVRLSNWSQIGIRYTERFIYYCKSRNLPNYSIDLR